jgi:fumarylacetoacetate (FAA) hydrolase
MKLATLPGASPDGRLVVVSRDLARCVPADDIAPTLLDALQRWDDVAPTLEDRFERLQSGDHDGSAPFDQGVSLAPLPRTPQWLDGSVFQTHLDLMARALHPERSNAPSEFPFIYQGASDDLRGPTDPIAGYRLDEGIDFEGEFGVVVDDVPMRVTADDALAHVRLLTLINDVSLRKYAGREKRGVVRQSARLGDDIPLRGADRPRRPHPSTLGRHDHRIGHGVERRPLRGFCVHRRAPRDRDHRQWRPVHIVPRRR